MVGDILQPTHLLFILVVALLVLGPKRLPEVGRSLGKGIRDFKGAMAGIEEHTTGLFNTDEPTAPSAQITPTVTQPAPVTPVTQASAAGPPAEIRETFATRPSTVQTVAVEPDPSEYAD